MLTCHKVCSMARYGGGSVGSPHKWQHLPTESDLGGWYKANRAQSVVTSNHTHTTRASPGDGHAVTVTLPKVIPFSLMLSTVKT
jgi:hypothetical protein